MTPTRFLTAAALLLASAGIANAYRNPTPPPSGIVVHLFGPDSIMSSVVPGLPGETKTSTHSTTGGTPAASGQTVSAGQAANTDSVNSSTDPTWGAIAHQLFVTGDPNDPTKPSSGRPGERPGAQ